MWRFGGTSCYWRRKEKEKEKEKREGIAVVFGWTASIYERQLRSFADLYASLGWDSLLSLSPFLYMFFQERAASMASDVLDELVKELKVRPCPVVFVSFSGGSKACMFKILQIVDGMSKAQISVDDCQLVRECISGYIYDSSPLDFTSDLGTRFSVHQSFPKITRPQRLASWVVNGIASGLDALFLNRLESQRAEYWQTLYSSVSMGVPYLFLCSRNDDLASYQIIHNFAQRLKELGADVELVNWDDSSHVGHYRHHPIDYRAAVTDLLGKAAAVYSQRILQLDREKATSVVTHEEVSQPIHDLRKATVGLHQSFEEIPLVSTDHFILPSSVEYYEGRHVGSMQDGHNEGLIHLPSLQTTSAHGILGQMLFDVCAPKNVEDWDIRLHDSMNRRPHASKRRHTPFNPIKCIRRSRL